MKHIGVSEGEDSEQDGTDRLDSNLKLWVEVYRLGAQL